MARIPTLNQELEDDPDSPPARAPYVAGGDGTVGGSGGSVSPAGNSGNKPEMALDGETLASSISYFSFSGSGQVAGTQYATSGNPTLTDEVTFISGLNPDGTLALY